MESDTWHVDGKHVFTLRRHWIFPGVSSYRIGDGRWRHTLSKLNAVWACTKALKKAQGR